MNTLLKQIKNDDMLTLRICRIVAKLKELNYVKALKIIEYKFDVRINYNMIDLI